MAECTAPVNGHRTASGAENCPACRGRSRGYSGRGYSDYGSRSYPSYSSSGSGSEPSSRSGSSSVRPRWLRAGSSVIYTPSEVQTLTPYRETVEKHPPQQDRRDVFLCHAWKDRTESAKTLHDLLETRGVSVWFSEKDVILGSSLLREIDKGLAKSRIGIVLVTPAFLERVQGEASIADKELSALLARDVLVPIVHNTDYEALREVSPLLASRSGLSTKENTMEVVADKLAELVGPGP